MAKKTAVEEKAKKRTKVYVCTKGEYTFTLPVYELDGFGKEIVDEKGNKKKLYLEENGVKKAVETKYVFTRIPVKDEKTGKTNAMIFLAKFILEPENDRYDEIEKLLDNATRNAYSGVMTEDNYKSQSNPEAYASEKQMNLYAGENLELKAHNEKLREALRNAGVDPDTLE